MADSAARRRAHRPVEGKASRAETRHDQIRRAALELFSARGYHATTIDDIGRRVGISGPSVYHHVKSKQALLAEIMMDTMGALLTGQREALENGVGAREQLRLVMEAHVRYHARHRFEAFVGNRELSSLEEPHHTEVLSRRHIYEVNLRSLIQRGVESGDFVVDSPRLASYALLDMGIGLSAWFDPTGEVSESDLIATYGRTALRVVGAGAG